MCSYAVFCVSWALAWTATICSTNTHIRAHSACGTQIPDEFFFSRNNHYTYIFHGIKKSFVQNQSGFVVGRGGLNRCVCSERNNENNNIIFVLLLQTIFTHNNIQLSDKNLVIILLVAFCVSPPPSSSSSLLLSCRFRGGRLTSMLLSFDHVLLSRFKIKRTPEKRNNIVLFFFPSVSLNFFPFEKCAQIRGEREKKTNSGSERFTNCNIFFFHRIWIWFLGFVPKTKVKTLFIIFKIELIWMMAQRRKKTNENKLE